jgi:hypothetical protein
MAEDREAAACSLLFPLPSDNAMTITSPDRIERLILDQLSRREMRLLALLVSLRRALNGTTPFKGDLGRAVNAALRRLIASGTVQDTGGVFSLWPGT